MTNNRGVTLIELLVVLVIMGIIAAFVITNVSSILTNTRIKVDTFNVATLNSVTGDYALDRNITSSDIFTGFSSDDDRMLELVEKGYLENIVVAQQTDAAFSWDVDNQTWQLVGGELSSTTSGVINYNFTVAILDDLVADGAVSTSISKWHDDSDGYLVNSTGETRLFIPISLNTYTVSVGAKLSDGTNGGYGVFFDTYLANDNESRDYGYILQFDRGYDGGSLVVRPRSNGNEGSPVWVLKAKNSSLFPSTTEDASWWTDLHQVKIVISNLNENTRQAEFYIDNVYYGGYSYTNVVSDKQIYSGLRGWGSYITKFSGFTVN